MQPLTFSANKHFIPVANKPLVYYPIETIAELGIKEVAITYNPGWLDTVKSYLGDGKKWGLKFTYVLQEKPLGLANIVEVCEEFIGSESFVFHLGDNIFTSGLKDQYDKFAQGEANGMVTMVKHPENTRLGVPYFDKKGRLVKYVEKPQNPPHSFAIPGVYFFDKNVFKAFKGKERLKPSARGEYEIPDAYQWLIDHGYVIEVSEYKGKWLDPGKFDDWILSNQYILDHHLKERVKSKIQKSNKVEGRVAIGKHCQIKNSEIRGPVSIGDNVQINNSYIGPYTSISDYCVIENSRIENSILMDRVTISGIPKPIDESLIGSGAYITKTNGPRESLELFVGEKSRINL